MVVDWFTVVAQIINFLVLVWLLKRFLYKPILKAIDARELRIATELDAAATKQSDADTQHDTFRLKSEELDAQQDALLKRATTEADEERQRLLAEARRVAETLRDEREEVLESEFQALQKQVTRRSRDEVFAITRKVLGELAGTTLEERMTELFIERLRQLDTETAKSLRTPKKDAQPMTIQSAFELNPAQQDAIQTALKDIFDAGVEVRFQTAPGVIAGIELTLDGHKIAWSVSEYLVELEKNISEILGEEQPSFRAGKTYDLV